MAENESLKMYLVEYWQNDGGWYDSSSDRTPRYTFLAKDDEAALALAKGFIQQGRGFSRTGYETFNGSYLAELISKEEKIFLENISLRVVSHEFTAEPGPPG